MTSIRNTNASIMLTHAENDFGTTAGSKLAAEFKRLHKLYVLKIYPPVGLTADDGYNDSYEDIPAWKSDVPAFLDEHLKD